MSQTLPSNPSNQTLSALVQVNCQLIDQALDLAGYFLGGPAEDFERMVGPHLRHVIEHLDLLCQRAVSQALDYDNRPRDAELERQPVRAVARLRQLRQRLLDMPPAQFDQVLTLTGRTGLHGQESFAVMSTVGRELAFMASHTVHHFALLRSHAQRLGWPAPPHFGKAPATVAHELAVLYS